jgi:hypothetical protein
MLRGRAETRAASHLSVAVACRVRRRRVGGLRARSTPHVVAVRVLRRSWLPAAAARCTRGYRRARVRLRLWRLHHPAASSRLQLPRVEQCACTCVFPQVVRRGCSVHRLLFRLHHAGPQAGELGVHGASCRRRRVNIGSILPRCSCIRVRHSLQCAARHLPCHRAALLSASVWVPTDETHRCIVLLSEEG